MLSTLNQVEDINVQDGDNLQSVENNNNFRVKVGEETEQKQKTMIDFDSTFLFIQSMKKNSSITKGMICSETIKNS